MATSWVFDLMLAAQQNNTAQGRGKTEDTKLWFKGGGQLGVQLDLGINEKYVSADNQKRVDGKDKVLGVIPSKADNSIPNAAVYNAGAWSLANATALSSKLKNPTVDSSYIGKDENASGQNRQNEAMLDFLSVYAATQAAGSDAANPNGTWGQLDLKYATGDYKKALFGDGSQTGGLIDASNVLVGGTAAPLGAAMTAESLAAFMGSKDVALYQKWLEPLTAAMETFSINTPTRIAAFLAQVKQESGGMTVLKEGIYKRNLAALYDIRGMFLTPDGIANYAIGQVVDKTNPSKILTATEIQQLAPANKRPRNRTEMEAFFYNMQQFYEGSDSKQLNAVGALSKYKMSDDGLSIVFAATGASVTMANEYPVVTWSDDVAQKFSDRYLSQDYNLSAAGWTSNGTWESKTAHHWIGRGLKQLTHVNNYAEFFLYLANQKPELATEFQGVAKTQAAFIQKLKSQPSIVERLAQDTPEGQKLAALSAGWFWDKNNARNADKTADGKLNDKALTITWGNVGVNANQEIEFNKISKGIGGTGPDLRWDNYKTIVKLVLDGGNPYENLSASLTHLGMSVSGKTGYEKAFGIALNKRSIQPIEKGTQNLVTEFGDGLIAENVASEWSATQEADLRAQADQWFDKQHLLNEGQSMNLQAQKMAAGILSSVLLTTIAPEVDASPGYAIGRCQVAQRDKEDNLSPVEIAEDYIYKYQRNNPKFQSISSEDFGQGAKVTVLRQPKLGAIEETKYNWLYTPPAPNADGTYVRGRDHVVMKVENKGVAVFVHYYIEVVGNESTGYYGENGQKLPHFCKRETWKISQSDFDPNTQDYAAWLRSSELSSLIATASQSLTGFQDLAGSSVGQTTGSGTTAQITLDTTLQGNLIVGARAFQGNPYDGHTRASNWSRRAS